MRLLTHNQLICVKKGCVDNYPLRIVPAKVEQEESEFNADFLLHIVPKLDYGVLQRTAAELGLRDLPERLPDNLRADEHADLLRVLHRVLLDTHVVEGSLVCNKCGRAYPVQQGIPNMRLNENEV